MLSRSLSKELWYSHLKPVVLMLTLLALAAGVGIAPLYLPRNLLPLIMGTIFGLIVCAVLGGKSILPIFWATIVISYFQGAIELLLPIPFDLGLAKYALLLGGGGFFVIRFMTKKVYLFSRLVLNYALLTILFYSLFIWMLVRSPIPSDGGFDFIKYAITQWATLNIPLVFLIYFELKSLDPVYKFLRFLVLLGIFAAGVGIIQYLLGPERLLGLGINVYNLRFAIIEPDRGLIFRVFSVFSNHYWFASFMVMSILAYLVLQLRKERRPDLNSLAIFFILIAGLIVTFNITMWLTLIVAVSVMIMGWSGKGLRILRYKMIWQSLVTLSIILLFTIAIVSQFRNRILGIFSAGQQTAGRSLAWRIRILNNSLDLMHEFLWQGMGPAIRSILQELVKQRDWFLVTSDVFFTWLILMGGLPLFLSYILLFIVPLWVAFKRRSSIPKFDRPLFWAIWALLFVGVVIGGVSNGALINSTPTNLLCWASIGVLLKMVVWNHSKSRPIKISNTANI